MQGLRLGFVATCLWLSIGGAALADVIDGNWCQADGRSMSINGPMIITPAGNQTTGYYARHSFSYEVPSTEPLAGTTVYMRLINETTVNLWMGSVSADPATVEVWKRCEPIAGVPRPPLPLG